MATPIVLNDMNSAPTAAARSPTPGRTSAAGIATTM